MKHFRPGLRVCALAKHVHNSCNTNTPLPPHEPDAILWGTLLNHHVRSWEVNWDGDIPTISIATRLLFTDASDIRGSNTTNAVSSDSTILNNISHTSHAAAVPTTPTPQRNHADLSDDEFDESDELEGLNSGDEEDPDVAAPINQDESNENDTANVQQTNSILVGDVEWNIAPNGVLIDVAGRQNHQARLKLHGTNQPVTELEYFKTFFPVFFIDQILTATNRNLRASGKGEMSTDEFWKFVGVIISLAVKTDPLEVLFKRSPSTSILRVSPNLSQFMSLGRYLHICQALAFGGTRPSADKTEAFWEVQPLVDAFNKCRRDHFEPGSKLCVDESRFSWRGRDQDIADGGAPFVSHEKRKPDNLAIEVKNVADVETGILLQLEFVSNKYEMRTREFVQQFNAGTGYLLRLCKPYFGSGRTVLGDSYFASVMAAVALRQYGLFFIGNVKIAHRKFPKQHLLSVPMGDRGSHTALTTTIDNVALRAVAWKDRKRFLFVSTCETTLPGEPCRKRRWRNNPDGTTTTFFRQRARPKVVEAYHNGAQKIDVHNHLRASTHTLRKTHRWQLRVFQGIVTMCCVDAFLAANKFGHLAIDTKSQMSFTTVVAEELLKTNSTSSDIAALTSHRSTIHELQGLSQTDYYKSRPNQKSRALRCRICSAACNMYCSTCSSNHSTTKGIVALCGPKSGRKCFVLHQTTCQSS